MKKVYSLLILFQFNSLLNAQPSFNWATKFDKSGLGYDFGLGITSDVAGNIYTIGRFSGQTDFDPSSANFILSANEDDIFITKSDPAGNFIWAKQIGGAYIDEGTSVVADKLQNVYITGYFTDSVDFDPGPGVFKLYSPFLGGFICKLYADGSFAWAHRLGATGNSMGFGICIDDKASLYVAGSFDGSAQVDFDPGPSACYLTYTTAEHAFICKFDSAGSFVWGKRTGGAAMSITIDDNKNTYVTGQFTGPSDFDPGPGSFYLNSAGNNNGGDGFVCKLDSAGNFQWASAFTASNSYETAECRSISSAPNGDVVVGGTLAGTVDFDPGSGVNYKTSNGDFDCFLCKLNSAGQFCWVRVIGGAKVDECYATKFGDQYKISVTGQFADTANFDVINGSYPLITPDSTRNAFVAQYDSAGNFLCAGSIYGGLSFGFALDEDPNGRVLVTGTFSDSADFDLGSGSFVIPTTPYNTAFVALYSGCSSILSMGEGILGSYLVIAPNPNDGYFTIYDLPKKSTLEIFDELGNLLQFHASQSDRFSVDLSGKPKGVYVLRLITEGQVLTQRIVVE